MHQTDDTYATLVATLGGQPQIVTFALDALLAQGEPISDVYLVHLSLANPRTQQALHLLQQEFLNDMYAGRRCRLRRAPIRANGAELTDIRTAADAEATWQCMRDLIADLKREGRRLHLCLSGGRRMIALLAMSAAALLCDHQDRIWHMHTPETTLQRVKDGAHMHVTPADGVQLIQAPLAPWGAIFQCCGRWRRCQSMPCRSRCAASPQWMIRAAAKYGSVSARASAMYCAPLPADRALIRSPMRCRFR